MPSYNQPNLNFPLISHLLHIPLRWKNFLCTSTNFWGEPVKISLIFTATLSGYAIMVPSVPIIWDVKWKSTWYINPLTSRTTVSPSCSNFKVLLTLMFLKLILKTNTFGTDLKLIGCIIPEKHWGHISCVSCSKDLSQWLVYFGVFYFSYSTSSNLSLMDGSEYSQLVHSGPKMLTRFWGAKLLKLRLKHLCLWFHREIVQDSESEVHVW